MACTAPTSSSLRYPANCFSMSSNSAGSRGWSPRDVVSPADGSRVASSSASEANTWFSDWAACSSSPSNAVSSSPVRPAPNASAAACRVSAPMLPAELPHQESYFGDGVVYLSLRKFIARYERMEDQLRPHTRDLGVHQCSPGLLRRHETDTY